MGGMLERYMKFVEFGATRIDLEQVSYFIDAGCSIEVFSGAKSIVSLTGLDAQKFRAEVEKHKASGGKDVPMVKLMLGDKQL
jgi:hypothetical protein